MVVERVDQVAGAVEDRQGHLSQVRFGNDNLADTPDVCTFVGTWRSRRSTS
jgi:hypothetical protein